MTNEFYGPREEPVYTPIGRMNTAGDFEYQMALDWSMFYLLEYDTKENSGMTGEEYGRMFKRFRDLSAYSLEHSDISRRRQGLELIALARFFGMGFLGDGVNQNNELFIKRRGRIPKEVVEYHGQKERIINEVKQR
jgi:hypothetical protein